ncbi:hypothetical protein RJT34_24213 [Clitoria ternatea]|uniref:C2 domain-containing protein n=1 Tax=Clitoria ternatea TaxID=43366 RepID=A0AAN9FMG9_CLITE
MCLKYLIYLLPIGISNLVVTKCSIGGQISLQHKILNSHPIDALSSSLNIEGGIMSNILACYQLLELNVISAQDLAPVGRSMQTYAVAWIDPDRKLSTRVDSDVGTNPAWNDKFVFRIDEDFLYDEESVISIDIYALHWFRDIHVGSARVLVGDVIPPSQPSRNAYKPSGMQFLGLQVHRPSGRPKGILNVGVAIIDSSMRSMPLYTHDTPTVGYSHDHHNQENHQTKREFRRTKSDTSSMLGSEAVASEPQVKAKRGEANSQVTASEVSTKSKKKSSSSILSGSGVNTTPKRSKFGRKNKHSMPHEPPNDSNVIELTPTPNVNLGYEVKSTPTRDFQDSPRMDVGYEIKSTPRREFQNSPRVSIGYDEVKSTPMREFQSSPRVNVGYDRVKSTPKREYQNSHRINVAYDEIKSTPRREFQNSHRVNVSYDEVFQNSHMVNVGYDKVKSTPRREFQNSPRVNVGYDEIKSTPRRDFQNSPKINVVYDEIKSTPRREFQNSPKVNVGYDEVKFTPRREFQNSPKINVGYDEVNSTPRWEFQNSPKINIGYDEVKSSPRREFQNTPARIHNNNNNNTYKNGMRATPLHAIAMTNAAMEYGTPFRSNLGRRPIMTDSKLGPSASEVAAEVARQSITEDGEDSTGEGWSLDDTVEELQPKVSRWQTELPPVYDDSERSSKTMSSKNGKHSRRHTDGSNDGRGGLFSCFSVICGVEFSIVCGGEGKKKQRRRAQSLDNESLL